MAAEPILEPIIEPVVIEPALELVPDWVPQPDVPQPYYGPLAQPQWRNVWDWVKDHAILPAGKPIKDPFGTVAIAQQMIDAATATIIKAMGGFINQAVQLEVDNFNALTQALDTARAAAVSDFNLLIGQTVQANHRLAQLEHVVVPALLTAIAESDQRAQVRILQSEARTQAWATDNIFRPLLETVFADQQALQHRMDVQHVEAVDHANQLNARTLLHIGEVVAPVAVAVKALVQESEDCVKPMCESMGPKTDLGKLLKLANVAAFAALLAQLAALRADGLEGLVGDVADWGTRVVGDFESMFFTGGKTLGQVIGSLPG